MNHPKSSATGVIRLLLVPHPAPPMDASSPFMLLDRITKWKDVVPWGQSLICYWALEAEKLLLHYSQGIKVLSSRCRMARKRRDSIGGLLGQEGRHSKWDDSFSIDEARVERNEQKAADRAWSTEIHWHAVKAGHTDSACDPESARLGPTERGKERCKEQNCSDEGTEWVQVTSYDNHHSGGFGE